MRARKVTTFAARQELQHISHTHKRSPINRRDRILAGPRRVGCPTHRSDPSQCAGLVCSARKSANVYLIARFVVSNHKPIGILDDFCEPKANSSTEELCDKIAVSPYSVVIMEFCTVPFVARDFMKASASRLQNESAARWAAYLLERKVAQRESAYIGTK